MRHAVGLALTNSAYLGLYQLLCAPHFLAATTHLTTAIHALHPEPRLHSQPQLRPNPNLTHTHTYLPATPSPQFAKMQFKNFLLAGMSLLALGGAVQICEYVVGSEYYGVSPGFVLCNGGSLLVGSFLSISLFAGADTQV